MSNIKKSQLDIVNILCRQTRYVFWDFDENTFEVKLFKGFGHFHECEVCTTVLTNVFILFYYI